MITIFNRKELLTVVSMKRMFRVKEALSAADISSYTKTKEIAGFAGNRRHGLPFIDQDTAYTYTVYVHKDDYERAYAAIQRAL